MAAHHRGTRHRFHKQLLRAFAKQADSWQHSRRGLPLLETRWKTNCPGSQYSFHGRTVLGFLGSLPAPDGRVTFGRSSHSWFPDRDLLPALPSLYDGGGAAIPPLDAHGLSSAAVSLANSRPTVPNHRAQTSAIRSLTSSTSFFNLSPST